MTRPPVPSEGTRRTEDERRRLAECASEEIRTCGRIQSHGVLFGIDDDTGMIVVASDGVDHLLGASLASVEDGALARAVANGSVLDPVRITFQGAAYDAIVHRAAWPTLVELEPVVPDVEYRRTGAVSAMQRLALLTDPDELRRAAAREIKAITGFDRVMCYEFFDDGDGRIVADEREAEMESYLDLRFPASDIPAQARALYVEKRSRAIVDTEDAGAAIRGVVPESTQVDLGSTELRSASPHHLQFMRNMGQASTVSLAVVAGDRLIGMFTCAHRTPYRIPVLLRRALEVLAGQVALQLEAAGEMQRLRRELDARQRRASLVAPLYGPEEIGDVLLGRPHTVRGIVSADAVVLRRKGVCHSMGTIAPPERVAHAVDDMGNGFAVTENLSRSHPELARRLPDVAGMLIVPLSDDGDFLAFFRGEIAREVNWLGDQSPSNRDDALSPRRSFTAWRESVTDQCAPWGDAVADATALGADIRAALAGREQAQLAELALRDPLTGLRNRRFLTDRIDELGERSEQFAIIFLDLDGFKAINDTHGHDIGDDVLIAVSRRLTAGARATDLVVRLGGDEFVIVCADSDEPTARAIADRVVASVREPIALDDRIISVTVSAGVVATDSDGEGDVLTRADAAMYRAKRSARGRLSA